MAIYGGVEAGGTKFLCAVGSDPQHILAETTIRTTTPEETIAQVVEFFREIRKRVELTAIGIGSFGPIDLNRSLSNFRVHHQHSENGMVEH